MSGRFMKVSRDFSARIKKKNINAYASSIAFFFFLSLVPMLIVICSIIPYTPLTEENLVQAIVDVIPPKVSSLLTDLVSDVYDKSAGIMSVAIIATVWSAAKGVMALMQGLNSINDVEEKRNYFIIRGLASFYTIVMLIIVLLSLTINVLGNQLVNFALYKFPQVQMVVSFGMHFRFLVIWAVMTILFAAIYAYLPNKKLKFKEQIPGAMFSAVVWSVFSWGFSLYISYGNAYGIYGSLSIIIIALLWMYFCMYIMMIGAYLNYYFSPVNYVLFNRKAMHNENDKSNVKTHEKSDDKENE